ncbi:hypothetical protein [Amycolatopsis sp. Hca4]|nr:hypothetical protein [Amycolatopsis sp. Hca4]
MATNADDALAIAGETTFDVVLCDLELDDPRRSISAPRWLVDHLASPPM